MNVGFIGLGTMGRHMASNLQKGGHKLVVYDVRREAAEPHIKAGATWAASPRAVAEAVDIVFTSLPGPVEVEAVALDEKGGLIAGLTAGKVYFDLSTNSPTLVRRIHDVFKARGIHMLDAPVSGGPKGAETRKLALWIGGDEDVYKRCKPVLDAIGDQPYYVGPIGAGSVAKLVHNAAGYVSRPRWPKCSRWASRPASIRSRSGKPCARAPAAAAARSTASSTSSCPASSTPRPSRYAWPTRTSRWRRRWPASTRSP